MGSRDLLDTGGEGLWSWSCEGHQDPRSELMSRLQRAQRRGQGLARQGYMRECLYWYQDRVLVAVVFEVDACIEA